VVIKSTGCAELVITKHTCTTTRQLPEQAGHSSDKLSTHLSLGYTLVNTWQSLKQCSRPMAAVTLAASSNHFVTASFPLMW